jgi:hypothetical protein
MCVDINYIRSRRIGSWLSVFDQTLLLLLVWTATQLRIEKLGRMRWAPPRRSLSWEEILPNCHFVLLRVQCLLSSPSCLSCEFVGICPSSPSSGYCLSIISKKLSSWCGVHLMYTKCVCVVCRYVARRRVTSWRSRRLWEAAKRPKSIEEKNLFLFVLFAPNFSLKCCHYYQAAFERKVQKRSQETIWNIFQLFKHPLPPMNPRKFKASM